SDGEVCVFSETCRIGSYCVGQTSGDSRCRSGESGSPCRGSYHCDEPFRCSNDYMGICEMPAARGEPCGPYGWCSDGTYCDGTICVPAKEDGATCTDHVECQGQCLSGVCSAICGGTYFGARIDSAPEPSCSDLNLERA